MAAAPFNPEAGARDSLMAYVDASRAIIRSECDYAELLRHRVRTLHPGLPCDSCGSVEYVPHSGLMICSYCRTPQEAAATPKPSVMIKEDRMFEYARKRAEVDMERRRAEIQREQNRAASWGYLWGSIFK